ncbi:MAG: hypothetical protein RIF37_07820 [Rhodospirillaceae bacterium]
MRKRLNLRKIWVFNVLLIGFAVGQATLSWAIRDVRPTLGILPDLPQQQAADALAFGDQQFLYRYLALTLQNAGDNGGRVTPLKNYDYDKVVAWLRLLDGLDHNSHWVIAMANGYFGQTQTIEDVEPIVRFMQENVAYRPELKWPWLVNAIHLSRHRLKNDWLALDAARQLATYDYPEMNAASLQMPALVLDDLQQYESAKYEIEALRGLAGRTFRPEEKAWMAAFVDLMVSQSEAQNGGLQSQK